MEYGLFISGIIIILISLFITYKQNNNDQPQDDYYLQSELLSELRALKTGLEERLNSLEENEFQEVLGQKVEQTSNNQDLIKAINKMQDKITELEEKIDRLESKMNYSLSNTVNSAADNYFKEEETEETVGEENQVYQEIKKLVEDGCSLAEVAQKLDMGTREVRLIWKFNSRGEG